LKLTTDRREELRGLSATAELFVSTSPQEAEGLNGMLDPND